MYANVSKCHVWNQAMVEPLFQVAIISSLYQLYIYIYTFGERKKSIQMEHVLPSLQPTVTSDRNRAPQLETVSMLCCWSMFIWELYLNSWVFAVPLLVIHMKGTSTAHTPGIHIWNDWCQSILLIESIATMAVTQSWSSYPQVYC